MRYVARIHVFGRGVFTPLRFRTLSLFLVRIPFAWLVPGDVALVWLGWVLLRYRRLLRRRGQGKKRSAEKHRRYASEEGITHTPKTWTPGGGFRFPGTLSSKMWEECGVAL